MLTNELVEVNDNHYYVDANGAMVRNTWVAIAADDDEEEDVDYRWYYFGPSGKAYKDSMGKTINGKKYGFDQDGKMYFGFIGEDGTSYNDEEDPIIQCTYYYGSNDDGARLQNAWLKYEDGLSDSYVDDNGDEYDDDYYWFRFKSNGKKITKENTTDRSGVKKVNGQKYYFDEHGVMNTSFVDVASDTNEVRYFSENLEDGSLKKNAWIRTTMPDAWENDSDHDYDDDDHWFRTNNEGFLLSNQTKKVNSKWYAFDSDGVMLDGLVFITGTDAEDNRVEKVKDAASDTFEGTLKALDEDAWTADDIYTDEGLDWDCGALFYFSADEEKDGAMKTGSSVKISLADDDYTFKFRKTSGDAVHGIDNHKVYYHGILQDAGDDTYDAVVVPIVCDDGAEHESEFLVNKSGTICKENKWYKDANDYYWVVKCKVNDEDEKEGYEIYRCNDKDSANAILGK